MFRVSCVGLLVCCFVFVVSCCFVVSRFVCLVLFLFRTSCFVCVLVSRSSFIGFCLLFLVS